MKKRHNSIFVDPTSKVIFDCIKAFLITMIVLVDIWLVASWLNVAFNNCCPETVGNIWSWNFFTVFFK